MERSKTLLIALLTVSAGAAAFVVAGSAFGQDWYEYKGRLTAGNAYLVTVPAGAEALELELIANGLDAAATVALFDQHDTKVAVWKLDADSAKATYVAPAKGDHVLFVYSLKDGGLSLRVSAEKAVDDLAVKRLSTERHDVRIASVAKPGPLSQKFATPGIAKEPIFATLLYSGSVENLVANVASSKGTVLDVKGETGTAYGPGLYGDVTGSRDVFPENLAVGSYTATATADRFEGDLYLTFVRYVRGVLEPREETEVPDEPVVAPGPRNGVEIFAGIPTAVVVPPGASFLRFSLAVEEEVEEDDGEGNYSAPSPGGKDWAPGFGRHYRGYTPDAVSVFTPDDKLLGVLTFDEDMTATIDVAMPGEYVVMVRGHDRGTMPVVLEIPEILVTPTTRELEISAHEIELGSAKLLGGGVETSFTLDKAPLGLAWKMQGSRGFAAVADGVFTSTVGEAVRQHQMVSGGFSHWMGGAYVDWAALVDGEYTFEMHSLAGHGDLIGLVFCYDRASEADEDEEH